MKILVWEKDGLYNLAINNEQIISKEKQLSLIVQKIEQYLKMRYLKEEPVGFIKGLFK